MRILGIETSCDETAAAVIENGTKILSHVVASSVELHQKTGGIIPEVAAREQVRCIIPVIQEAIRETHIDAIAITVGPGLIGSLLVGVETAKTLAYLWKKPIVPINHLQAHLYANWLTPENMKPEFPAIGLVVSGGHTDLVLMKGHRQIKWLGGTRDDAAGECFDKCARLLGLGYPGGPAISAEAEKLLANSYQLTAKLPRPMIHEDNFDFSFSGLKTAVLNRVQEQESGRVNIDMAGLAYEIQEAITDVLVVKTKKATEKYKVKSVLLAGGVVANPRLREKMQFAISHQLSAIKLFVPAPSLCTDNATFVASCAYFNYHPVPWQKIQANSSLEIEEMIK
ncbi:tRNA (adenosine(37)-N6)-threonylcarbamoyltransferase complex transferase subunit TsaD [Patescibacteria group bacterium]|nr:tRNA (adenosine(37)-N6)-threonylcarbamoyltransferase complex transferase subunit TsaD [Patescibacteria group bacterium]